MKKSKKCVLISIHMENANRIFNRQKLVELRKKFPADVDKVYVYCPKKGNPNCSGKVVGHFSVIRVLKASPAEIWKQHGHLTGLLGDEFDKYFEGRKVGYSIKIAKPVFYDEPLPLDSFELAKGGNVGAAPQGYILVKENNLDTPTPNFLNQSRIGAILEKSNKL